MKIAIVGFALSGFSFLKEILDKKKNYNLQIDIYKKEMNFLLACPMKMTAL